MLKGYLTPSLDPLKFAKTRGKKVEWKLIFFKKNCSEIIYLCIIRVIITEEHNNIKDLEDLAMEFVDLERATYNFSDENKLGEGGSGPVYKVNQ